MTSPARSLLAASGSVVALSATKSGSAWPRCFANPVTVAVADLSGAKLPSLHVNAPLAGKVHVRDGWTVAAQSPYGV
jgi:hypothetical protein